MSLGSPGNKAQGKRLLGYYFNGEGNAKSRRETCEGRGAGMEEEPTRGRSAISKCSWLLNLQGHIPRKLDGLSEGPPAGAREGEIISSGSRRPVFRGSPVAC